MLSLVLRHRTMTVPAQGCLPFGPFGVGDENTPRVLLRVLIFSPSSLAALSVSLPSQTSASGVRFPCAGSAPEFCPAPPPRRRLRARRPSGFLPGMPRIYHCTRVARFLLPLPQDRVSLRSTQGRIPEIAPAKAPLPLLPIQGMLLRSSSPPGMSFILSPFDQVRRGPDSARSPRSNPAVILGPQFAQVFIDRDIDVLPVAALVQRSSCQRL